MAAVKNRHDKRNESRGIFMFIFKSKASLIANDCEYISKV
jgi:hypothetical protein